MRKFIARTAIGLTMALVPMLLGLEVVAPSSASAAPSTPGVTATTIKIGVLSDLTGIAASTFETTPAAIEAAFKQINKAGGINGRKIIWSVADTQSSPTGAATAVKDLVETQHVFAIAEVSALFFAGAPFLNQAGVPVTGSSLDGPEWYKQPNTNLFNVSGNASPSEPAYTDGGFWKSIGASKISYVESNTPSSISAGVDAYTGIAKAGLSACDQTVVPLGAVNFTTYALSFKNAGCDTAECSCVLSSSLAMATALKQEGLTNVKIVFAAGPSQQIIGNAQNETAADGAYFPGTTYQTPAGKAFLANLKKYDSNFTGGIPDLGGQLGYPVGLLMVRGLQVAGKNLTRGSFIKNLRKVTDWNEGGLATLPISFVHFGQSAPRACATYVQFVAAQHKYVAYKGGKQFCGTLIPGSAGVTG